MAKIRIRNIFGRGGIALSDEDKTGIVTISSLSGVGEEGIIYYNSSDGKYYVYKNSSFTLLGDGVISAASLPLTGEAGKIYYNSTDGKYYIYSDKVPVGYQVITTDRNTEIPIKIAAIPTSNVKHTYYYGDRVVFAGHNHDFLTGCTATGTNAASYAETNQELTRDLQGFYLEPNKFYNLGTIDAADDEGDTYVGGLRLYCFNDSTAHVKEFMGRFTVDGSNFNLTCLNSYPDVGLPTLTNQQPVIPVTIPDDTPDFEDGHTYEFNISASVLCVKDITYTEPVGE